MEATQQQPQQQPEPPVPGIGDDAPEAVRAAAAGGEVKREEEKSALDWFLGATQALEYDVPVMWETPKGLKRLIFHMQQVDSDRLDEIDAENRAEGPMPGMGKLDTLGFNAAAVYEATLYVTDDTGRQIKLSDTEFTGGIPSPVLALRTRFKKQAGLLETLADRIREKAGYGGDRVGSAQRSLVEVGKS